MEGFGFKSAGNRHVVSSIGLLDEINSIYLMMSFSVSDEISSISFIS
jgi:hypothetical protein